MQRQKPSKSSVISGRHASNESRIAGNRIVAEHMQATFMQLALANTENIVTII
jgi:hypothetical protein